MNTTTILNPFDVKNSELDKELQRKYSKYYNVLRKYLSEIAETFKDDTLQKKPEITLNHVLEHMSRILDCEITLDDYYLMLRSSLKSSTVFLKRTCRELMLNQYNREILLLHRANMDIQHVTDPYGVAVYVSAYLTESNKHLSATLRKASDKQRSENANVRKRLNNLANVFHNSSEMGAQESVYQLLSMPVCKSSRQTVFVNTYRTKNRSYILKEVKWLDLMNPNDTDVFRTGLLEQYKMRPKEARFENMCLAEYASQWLHVSKEAAKNMYKLREDKSLPAPFPNEVYINEDEDQFLDENDESNNFNVFIFSFSHIYLV